MTTQNWIKLKVPTTSTNINSKLLVCEITKVFHPKKKIKKSSYQQKQNITSKRKYQVNITKKISLEY